VTLRELRSLRSILIALSQRSVCAKPIRSLRHIQAMNLTRSAWTQQTKNRQIDLGKMRQNG
jgi:hypothetical protein